MLYFDAFSFFLLLPVALATKLSPVTSSVFDMILTPVQNDLDASVGKQVESSIKFSLFQSMSIISDFQSVFDIDIVLQKVDWSETDLSTTVQFKVHATFFYEDFQSSTFPPSQFALDSIIARTFSQPSTKSGFIVQLGQSKEPSLGSIRDISIQLAQDNGDSQPPSDPIIRPLSTLDIVLISASATSFLGIIGVLCIQHQERDTPKVRHRLNTGNRAIEDGSNPSNQATPKRFIPSNIEHADSLCSDDHKGLDDIADDSDTTATPPTEGPNGEDCREQDCSSVDFSSDNYSSDWTGYEEDVGSPPLSPFSSVSSDSSEHSQGNQRTLIPSLPVPKKYVTACLLGAPPPNYTKVHPSLIDSTNISPLTAQLLGLPEMNADCRNRNKSPFRTSSSAPGKFMSSSECQSLVSSTDQSTSRASEKSARSDNLTSTMLRLLNQKNMIQVSLSQSSSNITDLAVISEQSILATGDTSDFQNTWEVADNFPEENEEDSSDEDVFHIGMDQKSNEDNSHCRMSGISAVSDWIKSVRVVGGSAGTKISDMSNSSAEHSSVEPKSMQMKEINSTDCSLERSLAASIVEV